MDFDKQMAATNNSSTLKRINACIHSSAIQYQRNPNEIKLLAVTKNQSIPRIEELLHQGHRLYGENRVQEAMQKWPLLKEHYTDLCLHFIGHLQSNKVKEVVALFDVVETLDSLKLAHKLYAEEIRQQKFLEYYIQINIGREQQKSGVLPENFDNFYKELSIQVPLKISGIMCIPPADKKPEPYFKEMAIIAAHYNFSALSMGMTADYQTAIEHGATILRIGRALFI